MPLAVSAIAAVHGLCLSRGRRVTAWSSAPGPMPPVLRTLPRVCQPLMPVVTMPWMKRFWAMKKMMNAGRVTSTLPAITVCNSSRM